MGTTEPAAGTDQAGAEPPPAGSAPAGGRDTADPAGRSTESATETQLDRPAQDEPAQDEPDRSDLDRAGRDSAAEEPPEPEDRWAAFAPPPPRPPRLPHRIRRGGAWFGRVASHEWTLTVLGGLALAALMTWPALRHARHTLPHDLGDPTLVTWILTWPGHAIRTDPAQLWHGNAFFPDSRWSLAYTDSLLGYLPFGLFGEGMADAVLRYNLIYVFAYGLAFIGAYALLRQLGAGRAAALVAGLAFAYAPWRLAQDGHLHVLSTGGIALALAMLARGHGWSLRRGFRRRQVRPAWIVAGWLVAAWQITIGFGIGLVFGYVLALGALVVAGAWAIRRAIRWIQLRRRPRSNAPVGRIVGANLLGGTVFAAVTVLMALPYLTVVNLYPQAQRSLDTVGVFSPPLRGFLIAPEHSWLWGSLHEAARGTPVSPTKPFWAPEMALLPGFALLGLAVAGLFFSIWSVRARLLLAGAVVVTVALAMGTEFFGGVLYEWVHEWLPGWDALRTPGRLIIWITLLLGVLAAGAVASVGRRAQELARSRGAPRPAGWAQLALLLPAALVLVEGINTTPHPVVPPAPAALASVEGPVLVLPSDQNTDMNVMMWTTERFVPVVNGGSGFAPPALVETREITQSFPDQASVDYLRSLGVSTVVVLPHRVVGTPWEPAVDASGAGLDITREEIDDSIVFHLDPPPGD